MKLDQFQLLIGVDQTGATKSNGDLKPLPTIVAFKKKQKWKIHQEEIYLESVTPPQVLALAHFLDLDIDLDQVFLCADCVFGLPRQFDHHPFRHYIEESAQAPSWGLNAGNTFFEKILNRLDTDSKTLPKRKVETDLGANSVFTHHPFQKNIQTGTFRFWKQMSQWGLEDYLIWPHDHPLGRSDRLHVIEGYPSLAAQVLLDSPRTAPVPESVSEVNGCEFLNHCNPDHKDAGLLVLLLHKLLNENRIKMSRTTNIEGEILGQSLHQPEA